MVCLCWSLHPGAINPKRIIRALGIEEEVLGLLRQEIKEAGSQSEWARRTGVNRSSLNQALSGRRTPGPDILRALKIQTAFAHASKGADDEQSGRAGAPPGFAVALTRSNAFARKKLTN